jgi:hypothetical protein
VVNAMVVATIDDSTSITIEWMLPVTASQLTLADLVSGPGGKFAISAIQISEVELQVQMSGSILTDIEISYVGSDSGFQPNQTIELA